MPLTPTPKLARAWRSSASRRDCCISFARSASLSGPTSASTTRTASPERTTLCRVPQVGHLTWSPCAYVEGTEISVRHSAHLTFCVSTGREGSQNRLTRRKGRVDGDGIIVGGGIVGLSASRVLAAAGAN